MRFRITHLLLTVVVVAGCAAAISHPNRAAASWMQLFAWLFYVTLAIRAITALGCERLAYLCAAMSGLSYLAVAFWSNYPLATSDWIQYAVERVVPLKTGEDVYYFNVISELSISFLMSLLGGLLGAFWTRHRPK